MSWPEPVTLTGPHATLRPLAHGHLDGLVEAVRDGELCSITAAEWRTVRQQLDRQLERAR